MKLSEIVGQQSSSTSNRTSSSRASRKNVHVKPDGFQDVDALVKDIFEGRDKSYYEWLHQKHLEVVIEFNLSNKESIASLAMKEGN